MRLLVTSLILSLSTPGVFAAGEDAKAAREKLNEAAMESSADFKDVYAEAAEAGVAKGDLLQAETAFALRMGNLERLLELAPQLEQMQDELNYGELLASREHMLGLVHGLQAVKAYQGDDWATFEKEAKASFWQWPEWQEQLGLNELIMQRRMQQLREAKLAKVVIPMEARVKDLDGEELTLASLAEGKKAVLVDFWASWCGPCMRLMPELKKKAQVLGPQGVLVAGLNTDDEDPVAKAKRVKDSEDMDMTWLLVGNSGLQELLMVDTIPRMALFAPDGKLLWTGHPMDKGLLEALRKLGVNPEA